MVVFLLDSLKKAGCPMSFDKFKCVPCNASLSVGGHYDFKTGVFKQQTF